MAAQQIHQGYEDLISYPENETPKSMTRVVLTERPQCENTDIEIEQHTNEDLTLEINKTNIADNTIGNLEVQNAQNIDIVAEVVDLKTGKANVSSSETLISTENATLTSTDATISANVLEQVTYNETIMTDTVVNEMEIHKIDKMEITNIVNVYESRPSQETFSSTQFDHHEIYAGDNKPEPVYNGTLGPIGFFQRQHDKVFKGKYQRNFLKKVHNRTWCQTVTKVTENYETQSLTEPEFEVNPQLKVISGFYNGEMTPKCTEYNKEVGFTVKTDIKELVTWERIMEIINDRKFRYIALVGQAGSGKTTMMKRLAHTFLTSNSLIKQGSKHSKEIRPIIQCHFKLVYYLNIRDIPLSYAANEADSFRPCDVLFSKLMPNLTDKELELGWKWVLENQSDILLFFDGLDQARWILRGNYNSMSYSDKSSTATILYNILTDKLLPSITIVISSREHSIAALPPILRPKFIAALAGLRVEDAKKLFIALLGDIGEKTWESMLERAPGLLLLSTVPLFSIFNAIVHKFYTDSPPCTMTGVMIQILQVFMRSDHTLERKQITEIFQKLMKMSLHGTRAKKVLFTCDDLKNFGIQQKSVRDIMIKVPGCNIMSQHLMDSDFHLFFSHQVLQEILAALEIAGLKLDTFEDFMIQQIRNDHWAVVLRFVCGILLNKNIKSKDVKDFIDVSDIDDKRSVTRKILIDQLHHPKNFYQVLELFCALYETNDADFIRLHVREIKFEGDILNVAAMYAISSVMRRCHHLSLVQLIDCGLNEDLMKILESNIENSKLRIDILEIDFVQGMNYNLYLSVAKFASSCQIKKLVMKPWKYFVANQNQIEELSQYKVFGKIEVLKVEMSSEVTPSMYTKVARFATLSEVKKLFTKPFVFFRPDLDDLLEISNWEICGKVVELDLSCRRGLNIGTFSKVGCLLGQCKVEKFKAGGCNLTSEQLKAMRKNMRNVELTELNISKNTHIEVDGLAEVGLIVTQTHVKILRMIRCNLNAKKIGELKKNIDNTEMSLLDISANCNLGIDGFASIGSIVSQCRITSLLAYECDIKADELRVFKENVKDAKLDELDISFSTNLGIDGFKEVASVVLQCKIEKLNIRNCSLTKDGARALRKQLCHSEVMLYELNISRNQNLGTEGFGEIGFIVSQCRLRILRAWRVTLTAEGIREFRKNVQGAKLEQLDVSWNRTLGIEGLAELGAFVSQCKIESIIMMGCELTVDGIKEFKKNLYDTKIKSLDLSSNSGMILKDEGLSVISEIVQKCHIANLTMEYCNFSSSCLENFKASISYTGVKFTH